MDIIPLYDRVKNQIYDDYQRVKRQNTLFFRARSHRKKVFALKTFRAKYKRLFWEVYALESFEKLPRNLKNGLLHFVEDTKRINSESTIDEVTLLSTIMIREMKINKITFDRDNDTF